jgi:hypothetical protein
MKVGSLEGRLEEPLFCKKYLCFKIHKREYGESLTNLKREEDKT